MLRETSRSRVCTKSTNSTHTQHWVLQSNLGHIHALNNAPNVKVPINPNFFFCFKKSLYRSEQNGAKIFVFGLNRNFLRIFKVAEMRDSKTHYRAGELAEREWVECNSWRKTQTVSFASCDFQQRWSHAWEMCCFRLQQCSKQRERDTASSHTVLR